MMLLLVMVKHTPILNIYIQKNYIVYLKHLLKYHLLKEFKLTAEVNI